MRGKMLIGITVVLFVLSASLLFAQDGSSSGALNPRDTPATPRIIPPSYAVVPQAAMGAPLGTATPAVPNPSFELTPDLVSWTVVPGDDPNLYYSSQEGWVDRSNSPEYRTDGVAGAVLYFSACLGGDRRAEDACYTGFGPSLHSSPFLGTAGEQVSVDWYVACADDWAVGRGYVRDASTNNIVATLFDSTATPVCTGGQEGAPAADSYFQTATAALPIGGTFYFDLQVGSYDASCGGCIGAYLMADNVRTAGSSYDLSYVDDMGRSLVCASSKTGDWQYVVLSGAGKGVYTGKGSATKLTDRIVVRSVAGSRRLMLLTVWPQLFKATASLGGSDFSSWLSDRNTKDDPPGCSAK